jgi:cellulose synthase/poly-beta-1,6-N-acetylglucosamine synthase-like glycosyltransferase
VGAETAAGTNVVPQTTAASVNQRLRWATIVLAATDTPLIVWEAHYDIGLWTALPWAVWLAYLWTLFFLVAELAWLSLLYVGSGLTWSVR